ncbi:MAG: T9SS type A sorting domain-containing protein [Bacteroidia bacterium]
MKKLYFILITFFAVNFTASAQQENYCDFDSIKMLNFGMYTGTLDSMFANPATTGMNTSMYCARYVRDTMMYDYIKMHPQMQLEDITLYADSTMGAPKMSLKVYSTAPVGTVVQLQLGIKSVDNYPNGIHSEYMAFTTMQNAWETLTFNYYMGHPGSFATATNIDKIVLLFGAGTTTQDTMYFDDLMGPALIEPSGIKEIIASDSKLFQNSPNPAKISTAINFQVNTNGPVSVELFDMVGNSVAMLLEDDLKAGNYSIPVSTSELPNGIYFYVLKKDGASQTKRMIVSK